MVSIMKFNYLICVYMTLQCLSMHWQSEAIRAQIHSLTVFRFPLVQTSFGFNYYFPYFPQLHNPLFLGVSLVVPYQRECMPSFLSSLR